MAENLLTEPTLVASSHVTPFASGPALEALATARVHEQEGHDDEAESVYATLLTTLADRAQQAYVYFLLSKLARRCGQLRAAINRARIAARLHADEPIYSLELGELQIELGKRYHALGGSGFSLAYYAFVGAIEALDSGLSQAFASERLSTSALRGYMEVLKDISHIPQTLASALGADLLSPEDACTEEIRCALQSGSRSIAFFCPTKAFRKQFGDIPRLLERAGYTVFHLFGEENNDLFETHDNAFHLFGDVINHLDFIDIFAVPTIMDCLPNQSKKILFLHSTLHTNFGGVREELENAKCANGLEEQTYETLIDKYTHLTAFFPLYDYVACASPSIAESFRIIAGFYGRQRSNPSREKTSGASVPGSDAKALLSALDGHRIARTHCVIPLGYPPLDASIKYAEGHSDYEKIITYAPTPTPGKPAWSDFASIAHAGKDIVLSLATNFPDYEIVFKPFSGEDAQIIDAIVEACAHLNNFTLDMRSASNHMALYSRTALLVSDFSSTAYTFALSTLRPVVFYSWNERNLPDFVKNSEYGKNRCRVGTVAESPQELVESVRFSLVNMDEFGKTIERMRRETIFNVGRSEQYFVDNFHHIASDSPNPEWRYYTVG